MSEKTIPQAPVFFRTVCDVCGHTFTTTDEDADMCGLCEADELMQLEMDRDRE